MRLYLFIFSLIALPLQAELRVVTSIQPLYEITSIVMAGAGKPELLIKSKTSTHHFSFKPSHFKLLDQADLVIWIDRFFEDGFQRMLQILPKQARQLELLRRPGLESRDGHLWYSPTKLPLLIHEIQNALAQLDPDRTSLYQTNADNLINEILEWQSITQGELKTGLPVYILDHRFLGDFEMEMGIEAIAVLHNAHDQAASIAERQQFEKDILKKKPRCLLSNESSVSKLGGNLARRYNLTIHHANASVAVDGDRSVFMQRLYRLNDIFRLCR